MTVYKISIIEVSDNDTEELMDFTIKTEKGINEAISAIIGAMFKERGNHVPTGLRLMENPPAMPHNTEYSPMQ